MSNGSCQWPWKDVYENRDSARSALKHLPRHRKRQGLHIYPCPAGHWHLGRKIRRPNVAWRSEP